MEIPSLTRRRFAQLAAAAISGAAARGDSPPPQEVRFESCYARWNGTQLTIGNRFIERIWKISGTALVPVSFRDLESGVEWNGASAEAAAGPEEFQFFSRSGSLGPVEAKSLRADLQTGSPLASFYSFQMFPDARGVSLEVSDAGTAEEQFSLPDGHYRFIQVTLFDQTDTHNELVFEDEWLLDSNEHELKLPGNVFILENTVTRNGLLFLKQGPLPHARPIHDEYDIAVSIKRGQGVVCKFSCARYPVILLSYTGGRIGRIDALQRFQRQKRLYDPSRDGKFLSNTWGDRSQDSRINAGFMSAEVNAGARLGVDVIQIDDGWQRGRTMNSTRGKGVWSGYWAADPNFWQPDPERFPEGLKPLVRQAAAKGMRFGLWYGPDSISDFANWERDANRLLELHRLGIDYFKLDSVKARSRLGEQNLHRLFDRVLSESRGRVVFDLDVTAEIRPGYFGALDTGPLFVENRYTDYHGYWPHHTLRNLWKLAHYVDPLRLRMEVLNNTRNTERYAGDPLAPSVYSPEYLFATVMVANPLGWFEISSLPDEYLKRMAAIVAVWKKHREEIQRGSLLPIGGAPDGLGWTGFVSYTKNSAHAILFRGIQCKSEWVEDVPVLRGSMRTEKLAGTGAASARGGRLSVTIPDAPGFLWVSLKSAGT